MTHTTPADLALHTHLQVVQDIIGLAESASLQELHSRTKAIVGQLGFEAFLYGVRIFIDPQKPFEFIFSGYPKKWREFYDLEGFQLIDPTVQHAVQKIIPLIWNPDDTNPSGQKFFEEAASYGLTSGMTIPISTRSGEKALLSLATSYKLEQSRASIMHALGDTALLATYLHQAIYKLVLEQQDWLIEVQTLTDREKECLKWSMAGKTAWEISQILSISERTVNFHMSNAVRKMKVSNKQQAISRASLLGIL